MKEKFFESLLKLLSKSLLKRQPETLQGSIFFQDCFDDPEQSLEICVIRRLWSEFGKTSVNDFVTNEFKTGVKKIWKRLN